MSNLDLTFVRMSCIHLEDRAGIGLRAFHFARKMGFSPRACWEIGIVVQELGSNVVRHAGGGHIDLHAGPGVLEVMAVDNGPGIASRVLQGQEFWSRGLGAVRRLMHELVIDTHYQDEPRGAGASSAERGTRVMARRYVERN